MTSTDANGYPLTALTLVLGPPVHEERRTAFLDFQRAAAAGERVTDHPWTTMEHDALETLAVRDGTLTTKTLLETWLGGVLQVSVIVSDVERQWVRYEDGALYASLTVVSEDVRPRAAALAVHDAALVDALNGVAQSLASIDGREWIRWSSRTWSDDGRASQITEAAGLLSAIASQVLGDGSPADGHELVSDLVAAVRQAHADAGAAPTALVQELRRLRYLDPLRSEWALASMDAFYLASFDPATIEARVTGNDRRGLAFLFLDRSRTERLKQEPEISPRFRAELAARAYLTAFALTRVAPTMAATLHGLITG